MYFYARLFGVSCYCISLLIFFGIIYSNKYKSLSKILNKYKLILCIMAFAFVPATTADLFRIFNQMAELSKQNINEIFGIMQKATTPISILYYYLIGKTGIKELLPTITTFLVCTNVFYIIKDYSLKNNINCKIIAISLAFVMSTGFFMELISNIRDILAFSILARCFYDEFYNKRKIYKNVIFYILAFLIHASAIALICLRVLYYLLFENQKKIISKIILIGIVTCMVIYFKFYFLKAYNKFLMFSQNEIYFWIWEFIKTIFENIACLLILMKQKKYNRQNPDCKNKSYTFNFMIWIFAMLNITEYSMFLRFSYFNVFMIIPTLLETMKQYTKNKEILKIKYGYNTEIIIFCIILLTISCTRGDLSSLKFFN